ncbi:hypothetical protein BFW87_18660 [Pseudomonas fluorescens]|uniref:Alginate export domain-containing protein n=1 Tax=Pseudomonas fluorescens TaxID=294 RepID=A0A1T2YHG8_PSEFL|nr:alginate export family protein [Pseudomonas fluorescens]OPA91650.1 hypothetical protein BFW87_18660 [Pseudomonas fluorescens]
MNRYLISAPCGAVALSLLATCRIATAGYTFEEGDFKGEFNFSASSTVINSHNANFGLGKVDMRDGELGKQNNRWQEYYFKPGVTFSYALAPGFSLIGGGSLVAAGTGGDGDAGGYSHGGAHNTSVEEAYGGFQAGDWRLTLGDQNYRVGNGFLVMDGNLDEFGEGAYFSAPRTAFRDAAVLGWQHEAVSAQAFSLKTDGHLGSVRMSGANIDLKLKTATLGAMAFNVDAEDEAPGALIPRDGMRVYNLRALNASVPGLDALVFNAEYAVERGSGKQLTYDASAWYASADYTFHDLPLQPTFGYRYATFSGDNNPSDNTRKDWNPLSKGYTDIGTWVIGDVVGNYLLYNTNEQVQTLRAKVHFNEQWATGAQYHRFMLNSDYYFGTPVSDRHFANETGVYMEWTPTEHIYTSLSYNWVNPQDGARQALGNDRFDALEWFFAYTL